MPGQRKGRAMGGRSGPSSGGCPGARLGVAVRGRGAETAGSLLRTAQVLPAGGATARQGGGCGRPPVRRRPAAPPPRLPPPTPPRRRPRLPGPRSRLRPAQVSFLRFFSRESPPQLPPPRFCTVGPRTGLYSRN
ncbi:WW domain-binding protein 11-like isoform X2 [Crotalus tigris]|uniref:WW domain-binding protein 11-like isoform X2 n=1 Tax=Crotalus tigris TaxID=88082 RepID=UPI00192F2A4A|nr:WW domain-binding protein 11-like isoform X2 [Crotalus tigris]